MRWESLHLQYHSVLATLQHGLQFFFFERTPLNLMKSSPLAPDAWGDDSTFRFSIVVLLPRSVCRYSNARSKKQRRCKYFILVSFHLVFRRKIRVLLSRLLSMRSLETLGGWVSNPAMIRCRCGIPIFGIHVMFSRWFLSALDKDGPLARLVWL